MKVAKQFHFYAAHYLPEHRGKCKKLHGHTYKMDVIVSGPIKWICLDSDPQKMTPEDQETLAEMGMVVDFGRLSAIVNDQIVDKLDHSSLNDFLFNPTAENLCEFVFRLLEPAIHHTLKLKLEAIRIWETETAYAEMTLDDFMGGQP